MSFLAHPRPLSLSRRNLVKLCGGAALASAGASLLPTLTGRMLGGASRAEAAATTINVRRHLAASDGWIALPGSIPPYHPDPLAPGARTTYVFGFRDVTGFSDVNIRAQKNKMQNPAPLLYFDEGDTIEITLSNLGLAVRPDLTDSHTIHWHGFRNAIPLFDGVPEMSIAVPNGREFPYFYHPTDPGTYMYHCHFEDVEHVQMGMTSVVFVRPSQNKGNLGLGIPVARYNGGPPSSPLGYVYNDGVPPSDPRSTAYDREFVMFLNEVWAAAHFRDAHIQESDWSDYHADIFLLNGRSYPDTLEANGGGTDLTTGDLIPPVGRPDLQYQPVSSLVQANAGERVLLRVVNLGYTQAAMRLAGIPMHVIGKDATPLRGLAGGVRTGADTSYRTDTIYVGPGESFDALFVAPPKVGAGYDTYLLFNRAYSSLTTPGGPGLAGQMTEVRVFASGSPAQSAPNT